MSRGNRRDTHLIKVFVYRNLHKKCWSVRALGGPAKGKVIARLTSLLLIDPVPKVSEKGRQRVLQTRQKNVHAGIVGYLARTTIRKNKEYREISYNPYKNPFFFYIETNSQWHGGKKAILTEAAQVFVLAGGAPLQ